MKKNFIALFLLSLTVYAAQKSTSSPTTSEQPVNAHSTPFIAAPLAAQMVSTTQGAPAATPPKAKTTKNTGKKPHNIINSAAKKAAETSKSAAKKVKKVAKKAFSGMEFAGI